LKTTGLNFFIYLRSAASRQVPPEVARPNPPLSMPLTGIAAVEHFIGRMAGCPSWCRTNTVKALKETHGTDYNRSKLLILSSSITGPLSQETLVPCARSELFDTSKSTSVGAGVDLQFPFPRQTACTWC